MFDPSGIGIIKIRRQKTNIDYITFCSTEAVTALKAYLEERNRIPQNVSQNRKMALDKLKIKGDNDYVFVDYMYANKLELSAFGSIFRREADRMGFFNGKGKYRKSRSHSLRKFFASTLENAGMPRLKVDYMLGHARSGNDLAYFQYDEKKLKEQYIKFLPYITFEKTIEVRSLDTKDGERLEVLEKENKKLMLEIGETKELKARIQEMEREIMNARSETLESMQQLMKMIDEALPNAPKPEKYQMDFRLFTDKKSGKVYPAIRL